MEPTPTTSPEAQQIIAQAPHWTFECDNLLLQWMQKISDNMEQRANQTSQMLTKLNLSVKRTETALENVSNSLTALQYTQFVENRVHDDDEDETKVIPKAGDKQTPTTTTPVQLSKEEVLKTFLHNNLEMLNNCHEKYALDFDDSDDENSTTYVYQPKNPYNERPLPHIYGSKLWKENWHVGLSDATNDYSGDESEAFSETSTSTENNASADTNSANISGWPSSASITNEKYPTQIAVQSASSLHGSQPILSTERINVPQRNQEIAAGSDNSSSTPSRMIPIHPPVVQHDLFAPLHGAPPSTSTSASSASISAEPKQSSNTASLSSASRSEHIQRERVDLFASDEPPPIPTQTQTTAPIKRKPVNLFDDDDFNSFMNEIVDKVQTKAKTPIVEQEPVAASTISPPSQPTAAPRRAPNIFEEVHTKPVPTQGPPPLPAHREEPKAIPKKSAVNLFDSSPESSPPRPSSIATNIKAKPIQNETTTNVKEVKTYITPKSLFDDDDEDDDFLNVFGTRKLPAQQKSTAKSSLFDDDMDDEPEKPAILKEEKTNEQNIFKAPSAKKVNLFSDESDSDENGNDLFGTPKLTNKPVKASKPLSSNIFDDNETSNENRLFDSNSNIKNKQTKSNIFDEVNDEEDTAEKDLFTSKKPKATLATSKPSPLIEANIENLNNLQNSDREKTEITTKKAIQKTEDQKVNLFSDSDDGETTNLFEPKTVSHNPEPPEIITYSQDKLTKPISHKSDIFSDSLFAEDSHEKQNLFDHTVDSQNDSKEEINDSNIREEHKVDTIEVLPPNTSTPESASTVAALVAEDSGIVENQSVHICTIQDEMPLEKENNTPISSLKVDAFQKVSVASNYTNIFSDEPPDDDDFFQTLGNSSTILIPPVKAHNTTLDEVFDEPALPQIPGQDKADRDRQPINSDYSGLRLFSDVPPDDDEAENNIFDNTKNVKRQESIKSLQHVFYDDFNETMQALQQSDGNKMPTHSLFDDEPPPDNGDFIVTSIKTDKIVAAAIDVNNTTDSKQLGQSIFEDETDKVAITATPIMDEIPHDTQTAKPEQFKPKGISKLPKVNINVQALLPNAGGKPNYRKSTSAEENRASSNEQLATVESKVIRPALVPSVSVGAEEKLNENILTSLCKNRVRVPPKRRPSTRKARQENYRKSLLIEDDLVENKLEDVFAKSIADDNAKQNNIVAPKVLPVEKPDIFSNSAIKDEIQKRSSYYPSDEPPDDFLFETKPKEVPTETKEIFPVTKAPNLESETKVESKPTSTPLIDSTASKDIIEQSSQYYVIDEPPDDFLFEPKPKGTKRKSVFSLFSEISDESENLTKTPTSKAETEEESKPISAPLPDSIFEPPTTNEVTVPTIEQKTLNKSEVSQTNKVIPPPATSLASASQLFGDSDDSDADDLFGSSRTNIPKSKPVEATNVIKPPITVSKKGESSKAIFLDDKDESDTDDLFKSNRTKVASKQTTPTATVSGVSMKSASLFESDNEDNDDFLSTLASAKLQKDKKTVKGESSKSLFSDEDSNDDDDDLFGVAKSNENVIRDSTKVHTTKTQTQTSSKSTTVASKAVSDTKTSSTISDNPLADLLK